MYWGGWRGQITPVAGSSLLPTLQLLTISDGRLLLLTECPKCPFERAVLAETFDRKETFNPSSGHTEPSSVPLAPAMLNIQAWAERYLPRLRIARGEALEAHAEAFPPGATEDAPLLRQEDPYGSRRGIDEDWAAMYNFDIPAGTSEPYQPKVKKISLLDKIRTRFHYYIPIFSWIPKYRVKDQLLLDVLTGIGVGAMLIPQALAYSLLAGLTNVVHGLLTAFVRNSQYRLH